jgi:DNA-binding NarL/FixJ family response regulator
MTKLTLIFDTNIIVKLESDLTPSQLVMVLNHGNWQPPETIACCFVNLQQRKIRAVALDEWVFALVGSRPEKVQEGSSKPSPLSNRQKQVLDLLAEGKNNKQIATLLGLSSRTVNMHIAALKNKLGAQTNAQTVGRGTELGYCRAYMRRRES